MAKETTLATRNGGLSKFVETIAPKLADVATEHMTPERLLKLFTAATSGNSALLQCTTETLASALLLSSQLGLEPCSPLGHLYLIPYGKKCTAIIGYKGMIELIRRTGEINRINAQVFYQQEIERDLIHISIEPPEIMHAFSGEEFADKDIAGAYCIVEAKDGAKYMEICTRKEIDARRNRSAAKDSGPWVTDFKAMARKCAIRKLFGGGTVPISAEKMAPIYSAMAQDGDSNNQPRTTLAQRRMSKFIIPATGEVIEWQTKELPEAEYVKSTYADVIRISEEMGASREELKEAIKRVGFEGMAPEEYDENVMTLILNELENMKNA